MTCHYTTHAEGHEERMAEYMRDLPPLERAQREQEEAAAGMEMQSRREKLYTALEILGNGSVEAGEELLFKIAERLTHARTKHPRAEWKGYSLHRALTKLQDEVEEQKYAAANETPERIQSEGLDVIAVEIRILNQENRMKL